MYSHFNFKKQNALRLLWIVLMAWVAFSNIKAQDVLNERFILTVNPVVPPYTNKLSDYFSTPGKIGGTILLKSSFDINYYEFYVHVRIICMDNEYSVGTKAGFKPANPRNVRITNIPMTTILSYNDISEAVRDQNLEYRGFTREQIMSNGLPSGTYSICMTLFVKPEGWNSFTQLRTYCSPEFRIQKKKPIINQTIQVMPPYTNKLSDYIERPGKINSVITITQYPDNEAFIDVEGMIEQVNGNLQIGSGQNKASLRIKGTPSGNNTVFAPYTLTFNDLQNIFKEPMIYHGTTYDQIRRNGLPDGTYRICFKLKNSRTGELLGQACSPEFSIQKKKPVINQTIQVIPPYTNKLSDYIERPGKINSVITITQYPDNEAFIDVQGTLERADGGIIIGSGQNKASLRIKGTPSGNNTVFAPYTLTYNDLREVFKEPMVYQGITRQQVQQNGLPEGTYRICFKLKNSRTGALLSQACSAPFNIQKKAPVINQTVAVMPPYTNKLSDYFETPGKIRDVITITQYPDNEAFLNVQGTLESIDGGIIIGSQQNKASLRIKGTPSGNNTVFAPYTLTYKDLRDIFKSPLHYQGIAREQAMREGLPDGAYRICFKVTNARTSALLSQVCSAPFVIAPLAINAIEPPQIVQPIDGSELPPEQMRTLQFTWTMPPEAPANTQYMLKIIELNDRYANYRDMLRNSSYPAFFETTVTGVPTYLYTPANPAFKEGKTYVFIVRAFSPAGVAQTNFKNDGYSEPATFTFKQAVKVELPVNVEPPKKIEPVMVDEGLKIFVPGCKNCNQYEEMRMLNIPAGRMSYRLQGDMLNPYPAYAPNPKKKSSSTQRRQNVSKLDITAKKLNAEIKIPAGALAVNNARNFYLRWEDKSSALEKRQPKTGEGIVYHLRISDARTRQIVWEKQVWNNNSYEQTKKGLPFEDKHEYILHITALRGVVTQGGFSLVNDETGKPETLASSCECEFTYMALPDVPDLEEYTVKGKLSYKFEKYSEKYPLVTTTATLTRYTSLIDAASKEVISDMELTPRNDRHSVPIHINEDGTFEVTFYAYPNNGLIESEKFVPGISGKVDLYEFFNLELNSPYYSPLEKPYEKPTKTIVNLTNKIIDLGEITYNVWSYTLEVEVSKGYSKWGDSITGSYRELNPPHVTGKARRIMFGLEGYEDVPYYEGDIPASEPKFKYGKSHITDGKTEIREGKDGKEHTYVTFDRLICNFQSNDHYNIDIEQELEVKGKKRKYETNEFKGVEEFRYTPDMQEQFDARKENKSNFLVKRKATLLDDTPPQSTVKGRLVFADPSVDINVTKPLANTAIALVVTYLIKDRSKTDKQTLMNLKDMAPETSSINNPNSDIQLGPDYQQEDIYKQLMKELPDAQNTVLATTQTDAEGNFEFKDFAMIDSCITKSAKDWGITYGLKPDAIVTRTVRLVINNAQKKVWLNPSDDIHVMPNRKTIQNKPFKALFNTYKLWIKPVGDPDDERLGPNQDKILKGVDVSVLRYPSHSGESSGVFVVDKKTVQNDKGCLFSVPKHWGKFFTEDVRYYDNGQEKYRTETKFLYSSLKNDLKIEVTSSDDKGEYAFEKKSIRYPADYYEEEFEIRNEKRKREAAESGHSMTRTIFEFCNNDIAMDNDYQDTYRFTNEYVPAECEIKVRMIPKKPIISGHVLDAENMERSVEKGEVQLKSEGGAHYYEERPDYKKYEHVGGNYIEKRNVSEMDNKGYFVFKDLIPNYKDYKEYVGDNTVTSGGDSNYQLFIKAKGYTLAMFKQKGKEKEENIESNIWFPTEPMKPKMGQQIHFPVILMSPNGWITGCVANEEGYAMNAEVHTTRSKQITTQRPPEGKACPTKAVIQAPAGMGSKTGKVHKGGTTLTMSMQGNNWFKVPAPSGYSDTLFVRPVDTWHYFTDTILIPSMPEGGYDVGTVVLKERKHRIRIVVREKPKRPLLSLSSDTSKRLGISGITVKIDAPGVEPKVTDKFGIVEFTFKNAENESFRYELIPPDDSEYIAKAGELTNSESKHMQSYYFRLKKGATVTGTVTSDGKPVSGAEVWVMNGNNKRQVKTDNEGIYTLRGIKPVPGSQTSSAKPAKKGKIQAGSKHQRNISKKSAETGFTASIYNATIHCAPPDDEEFSNLLALDREAAFKDVDGSATVDFELEPFYKANIQTLHGFNINVTDITEDGSDAYRISGRIKLDKAPGKFEIKKASDQNPHFKDLKVRVNNSVKDEKGRPYFEVVGDNFSVGMKLMNVKLHADGTAGDDAPEFEINQKTLKTDKLKKAKNKKKAVEKSKGKLSELEINQQSVNMNAMQSLHGGHTYAVQLTDEGDAFLKINKDGITGGFIRSKAQIEATSFEFPSGNFEFDKEQFYISDKESGNATGRVTSFKSYADKERMDAWEKEAMKSQSYALHDAEIRPLMFKFAGFDATSPLSKSRLGADGVIRLKPDVWLINPLLKELGRTDTIRLDLPKVYITPKQVEGNIKLDKINVKFEEWNIEVNNCQIDASKGGIISNNVVLHTGKLDFPATTFRLDKERFLLQDFEVDKVPLGKDMATIDIEPESMFQFGSNPKCGKDMKPHLMIGFVNEGGSKPVGNIKELPGFKDPLEFQSIMLTSDGSEEFGFAPNSQKIRLYDVVDFLPYTIYSYDDEFNIDGAIDYGIPRIATNINHKLIFKKRNKGKLKLIIGDTDISFKHVKEETFKSLMSRKEKDKKIITDGLVKLYGTIEEEGALEQIRVVVWKKRTAPNKYDIWMDLEDRDNPQQTICLGDDKAGSGNAEFRVEKADKVVLPEKNDWDLLRLKLVPSGAYGDKSGFGTEPLYFELGGELRTDTSIDGEKQQIKMVGTDRDPETDSNNQDGFMDFVLVYDYPNQELVGDMTITEKKIAGMKFSGDLHMVIGRPGFYFMGAGSFAVPSLGEIKGGMIFGYYNKKIPENIWSNILKYSARNEVPCCFTGNSFRGFYAMGALSSIPGIGKIDEGGEFAGFEYKFTVEFGAEAALWGSFLSAKNEIGTSAMLYAKVVAVASVPLLKIGVEAEASIKGYATMLFNPPYTATLGMCGQLTATGCIKANLILKTIEGSISKSAHAGIETSIKLSNPTGTPNVKTSFGWGTCTEGFGEANCPIEIEEKKSPCD